MVKYNFDSVWLFVALPSEEKKEEAKKQETISFKKNKFIFNTLINRDTHTNITKNKRAVFELRDNAWTQAWGLGMPFTSKKN